MMEPRRGPVPENRLRSSSDRPRATAHRLVRRPLSRLVTAAPGGPGNRSGGTTTAPQGACWTGTAHEVFGPARAQQADEANWRNGPGRKLSGNQETRTRGSEIAAVERREAPAPRKGCGKTEDGSAIASRVYPTCALNMLDLG